MTDKEDRTVHAYYRDMEVVRYDRAGKWYLEPMISGLSRQLVTIGTAVQSARWGVDNAGGAWIAGLPGGKVFDRKMKEEEAVA